MNGFELRRYPRQHVDEAAIAAANVQQGTNVYRDMSCHCGKSFILRAKDGVAPERVILIVLLFDAHIFGPQVSLGLEPR